MTTHQCLQLIFGSSLKTSIIINHSGLLMCTINPIHCLENKIKKSNLNYIKYVYGLESEK